MYGSVVTSMAGVTYFIGVKRHFVTTYLHVAAVVVFGALVSGVTDGSFGTIYLAALLLLGYLAVRQGLRFRHFAFVAYGVVFGYLGLSIKISTLFDDVTLSLLYVLVSGTAVVGGLVLLSRRVAREP
jgi:hypothetical protein